MIGKALIFGWAVLITATLLRDAVVVDRIIGALLFTALVLIGVAIVEGGKRG